MQTPAVCRQNKIQDCRQVEKKSAALVQTHQQQSAITKSCYPFLAVDFLPPVATVLTAFGNDFLVPPVILDISASYSGLTKTLRATPATACADSGWTAAQPKKTRTATDKAAKHLS